MVIKHPKTVDINSPDPENVDIFLVTEFELYKALMSSGAGPDKIVPQIFKDLITKSNGNAVLIFLKSLTKLLNLTCQGKVPEQLRAFFFGEKLIALAKID